MAQNYSRNEKNRTINRISWFFTQSFFASSTCLQYMVILTHYMCTTYRFACFYRPFKEIIVFYMKCLVHETVTWGICYGGPKPEALEKLPQPHPLLLLGWAHESNSEQRGYTTVGGGIVQQSTILCFTAY